VPGGGWYKQGFTTTNEADYSKTIAIPDLGQPQVTKIKFGAVNVRAIGNGDRAGITAERSQKPVGILPGIPLLTSES
jgi:hypothetical protein